MNLFVHFGLMDSRDGAIGEGWVVVSVKGFPTNTEDIETICEFILNGISDKRVRKVTIRNFIALGK